ncbi:MAG: 23S rRNA (adenine(2503)-C(2))-methyltransferase RlmN [Oscillospiraceae bacterium]|nr:23S rRNA (adenine(2503)-C(2))-methyltransferase RlmN [Oscillospiraceae bacterium]
MNLKSLTQPELANILKELGQPAFRAKQVFTWLHKGVRSYEEMTNLPKSLRDILTETYPIRPPKVVRKQESQRDGTIKYLWELSDGNCVETVLMRYNYGNTVCISTEVGCRMGCAFCASTIGGLVRPLEPFEMLDEVLFTQIDSGLPISRIVLMGIGEPLDNFDNVMRFLELVNSPDGMNISMRHISLSTCGLVPKIDELAQKKLQISLAISLHGPNNEIRNKIMPVNRAYPIEELLEACRRYYAATSRRIHFEYAMIDGVNDREEDAKELLRRMKGLPAHFNLIPLNHVEESPLKPSTKANVARFQKLLEDGGITATVRRTLGGDIDASCGQLRRKHIKEKN